MATIKFTETIEALKKGETPVLIMGTLFQEWCTGDHFYAPDLEQMKHRFTKSCLHDADRLPLPYHGYCDYI